MIQLVCQFSILFPLLYKDVGSEVCVFLFLIFCSISFIIWGCRVVECVYVLQFKYSDILKLGVQLLFDYVDDKVSLVQLLVLLVNIVS